MAYREVTLLEVKELVRQWLGGAGKKRIAAKLKLNVPPTSPLDGGRRAPPPIGAWKTGRRRPQRPQTALASSVRQALSRGVTRRRAEGIGFGIGGPKVSANRQYAAYGTVAGSGVDNVRDARVRFIDRMGCLL
jgi:hypothetical protein